MMKPINVCRLLTVKGQTTSSMVWVRNRTLAASSGRPQLTFFTLVYSSLNGCIAPTI